MLPPPHFGRGPLIIAAAWGSYMEREEALPTVALCCRLDEWCSDGADLPATDSSVAYNIITQK